jgi:hypothetical protein
MLYPEKVFGAVTQSRTRINLRRLLLFIFWEHVEYYQLWGCLSGQLCTRSSVPVDAGEQVVTPSANHVAEA